MKWNYPSLWQHLVSYILLLCKGGITWDPRDRPSVEQWIYVLYVEKPEQKPCNWEPTVLRYSAMILFNTKTDASTLWLGIRIHKHLHISVRLNSDIFFPCISVTCLYYGTLKFMLSSKWVTWLSYSCWGNCYFEFTALCILSEKFISFNLQEFEGIGRVELFFSLQRTRHEGIAKYQ